MLLPGRPAADQVEHLLEAEVGKHRGVGLARVAVVAVDQDRLVLGGLQQQGVERVPGDELGAVQAVPGKGLRVAGIEHGERHVQRQQALGGLGGDAGMGHGEVLG